MQKLLFLIVFLAGLSMIVLGTMGVMQLRSLAGAEGPVDVKEYPIVNTLSGDLIGEAAQDPRGISLADLASRIQTRMLLIGGFGMIVLLCSFGLLLMRKDERAYQPIPESDE